MYEKRQKKWDKHIDFIIFDKIAITLAIYLGYFLRHGWNSAINYGISIIYIRLWVILMISDLCVGFLFESYKNIVRRGYLEELKKTIKHCASTDVLVLVCIFISKETALYSRETLILYFCIHIVLVYLIRCIRKHDIRKKMSDNPYTEHMLILTDDLHKDSCVSKLKYDNYRNYKVIGVVVAGAEEIADYFRHTKSDNINEKEENFLDDHEQIEDAIKEVAATKEENVNDISGVRVVCSFDELEDFLLNHVVDSIFINMELPQNLKAKLLKHLISSGVTVHVNLMELPHELMDKSVERIGEFTVLTSGMRIATRRQLFEKRLMDICGGFVGVIIMLIATVFFAPIIYMQSPGPIFFKQSRVGKNGRIFKIYKFRSMYMDAEERKKELMSHNKMDGLMFKMDNDPRITPIGRFIRKYSIDELPQFINVLKGDMSLVGTRPPTVDEYEQYQLHHMGRLSSKPGITGLWQVSGRSDMTDFEKIVELDTQYISNWSLSEDIRILWRTVKLVLKGEGAE